MFLGLDVKQLQDVASNEDQVRLVQQVQVVAALTVVAKRVSDTC